MCHTNNITKERKGKHLKYSERLSINGFYLVITFDNHTDMMYNMGMVVKKRRWFLMDNIEKIKELYGGVITEKKYNEF